MTNDLKGIIFAAKIDPHPTRKGLSLYTLPNGRVFSCQPDGSAGDRPPGADGGYESGQQTGNVAAFHPDSGKYYAFGIVPVDKL